MTTREIHRQIKVIWQSVLLANGLAYTLRKLRNREEWIVQIGEFNHLTDPYLQSEINDYWTGEPSLINQFGDILQQAKDDKLVCTKWN